MFLYLVRPTVGPVVHGQEGARCRAAAFFSSPTNIRFFARILFGQVAFPEAEGEQAADGLDDIDLVGAVEIDAYGVAVALFGLEYHLAAGPAGSRGVLDELSARLCGDGQRLDRAVGVLRVGIEEGGAFGAGPRGVGGILLIAARYQHSTGQTHGSPYLETGVGRIGAVGGLFGGVDQFFLGFGELFIRANHYLCGDIPVFHNSH